MKPFFTLLASSNEGSYKELYKQKSLFVLDLLQCILVGKKGSSFV